MKPPAGSGETARRVAELLTLGMSQDAIAAKLGRTKATINWHARRMSVTGAPYLGREFIIRVLGYSGVRNSELCDLRIGQVRLHDAGGARFHIPDAKTDTGVRVVEMSPDLAEAFVAHLDRLRRAGKPAGLEDYVVQNTRGGRIRRQRVAGIVREAATLASHTREQHGLPPLPRTTPHSLRRTYISIALLANNFDVKWVMSQVGHADSKMTLDVYAQLEQRIKRDHGRRFDEIVRSAEEQMHGDDLEDAVENDAEEASREDDRGDEYARRSARQSQSSVAGRAQRTAGAAGRSQSASGRSSAIVPPPPCGCGRRGSLTPSVPKPQSSPQGAHAFGARVRQTFHRWQCGSLWTHNALPNAPTPIARPPRGAWLT